MPRVLVRIGRADTLREHFLQDLTEGGLFVRTEQTLPVDSEVDIGLVVPGQTEPLELHGRVVRVADDAVARAKGAVGMGIRFEGLSPKAREGLLVLLAEHSVTPALVTEVERLRAQAHGLVLELAAAREATGVQRRKSVEEEALLRERDELRGRCVTLEADLASLRRAVEGLARRLDEEARQRTQLENALESAESELLRLRDRQHEEREETPSSLEIDIDEESWVEVVEGGEAAPARRRSAAAPSVGGEGEDDDTWVEVFMSPGAAAAGSEPVPERVPLGGPGNLPVTSPMHRPLPTPLQVPAVTSFRGAGDAPGAYVVELDDDLPFDDPPPPEPAESLPFELDAPWQAEPVEIPSDAPDDAPFASTRDRGRSALPWELPQELQVTVVEDEPGAAPPPPPPQATRPPPSVLVATPPRPSGPAITDFPEFLRRLREGARIARTERFHLHTPHEPMVLTVMNWLESVNTLAQLRECARGRMADDKLARAVFELYTRKVIDLEPPRPA